MPHGLYMGWRKKNLPTISFHCIFPTRLFLFRSDSKIHTETSLIRPEKHTHSTYRNLLRQNRNHSVTWILFAPDGKETATIPQRQKNPAQKGINLHTTMSTGDQIIKKKRKKNAGEEHGNPIDTADQFTRSVIPVPTKPKRTNGIPKRGKKRPLQPWFLSQNPRQYTTNSIPSPMMGNTARRERMEKCVQDLAEEEVVHTHRTIGGKANQTTPQIRAWWPAGGINGLVDGGFRRAPRSVIESLAVSPVLVHPAWVTRLEWPDGT